MTNYTPGWQVSFPEPTQWNGDDDRERRTATGPRHEMATCYECGTDTDERPSLDGHTFCSRACMDAWVRR